MNFENKLAAESHSEKYIKKVDSDADIESEDDFSS